MKILFAASEAWPLAKTGGLADVAYALPLALDRLGADVRTVLPAYRGTLDQLIERRPLTTLQVRGQPLTVWEGRLRDQPLRFWLLQYAPLYERDGDPYHDAGGQPWSDNGWRFGTFGEACAQLAVGAAGGWRPDVVHANDWQAGLVAPWLRHQAARPRTVFTIHNLAYQGNFDASLRNHLGLPADLWSIDGVEAWGQLNFMKGGITCSDRVTTVSPTYAREIQTPAFGCGLENLLRAVSYKLSGILNGIDDTAWNPATDEHLVRNYRVTSLVSGKRDNRRALQRDLGLSVDEMPLLVGFIGRLAYQKGTDLLLDALPQLLALPVQFAILASGDRAQAHALREAVRLNPGRIGLHLGYDERLAHRIEAGSDAFLMPSRYEPCGLNQMYSQRYGTVPLVRRTGGLADTVTDATAETLAAGTATGVCFNDADVGGVIYAVRRALELRAQRTLWRAMQKAGMKRDFSWTKAAREYLSLYEAI